MTWGLLPPSTGKSEGCFKSGNPLASWADNSQQQKTPQRWWLSQLDFFPTKLAFQLKPNLGTFKCYLLDNIT